ncbi:TatD family hydrolase [Candidatus Saccharibacteria bacterium]|nr:TatD family hydrolase [Candidatus Saccharibacteria bacterium]
MLIDSHSHLHDKEFFSAKEAKEALIRAREKGVLKIVCIGTSHADSLAAQEFAKSYNDVYWTYGIHPENAGCVDDLMTLASDARPVAIGEVGLDYHYDGYDRGAQIRLFEQMLQLARERDLPLSFHVREAFDDFFPVIQNFPGVRGVVHSFSDNKKNLKRILNETNFYVGVNGMATYSTLPTPPLDRILLETDAPFLTPAPFRGEKNESGFIREIALWLSEKLEVDFGLVEKETTKNACELFKF